MSTPPVEKLRCKGCCGDGLERTTAAERMALAAVIVMAGAMLGLGRVGGGSGWLLGLRWHGRWCAEGMAGAGWRHLGDSPGFRPKFPCRPFGS